MAMITPAALTALHTSFSTIFQSGYDSYEPFTPKIATIAPSSTTSNTYGWMQRVPQLRQWVGAKVVNDISAHSYALTNLPFELTIGVDRHDWEDENLGVYTPLFSEMGRAAAEWPDIQTAAILTGNPAGFDGVALFNAAHPLDPAGNQTNTNTLALTPANYATVREAMMLITGEDSRPLRVRPDTLIVPPQLEREAKEILLADRITDPGAGGASVTNVNRGTASMLVIPELGAASATAWYLADLSKAIKPVIWQLREAPMLISKAQRSDDNVFWDRELVWGTEARGVAGVGFWPLIYRGNV